MAALRAVAEVAELAAEQEPVHGTEQFVAVDVGDDAGSTRG